MKLSALVIQVEFQSRKLTIESILWKLKPNTIKTQLHKINEIKCIGAWRVLGKTIWKQDREKRLVSLFSFSFPQKVAHYVQVTAAFSGHHLPLGVKSQVAANGGERIDEFLWALIPTENKQQTLIDNSKKSSKIFAEHAILQCRICEFPLQSDSDGYIEAS